MCNHQYRGVETKNIEFHGALLSISVTSDDGLRLAFLQNAKTCFGFSRDMCPIVPLTRSIVHLSGTSSRYSIYFCLLPLLVLLLFGAFKAIHWWIVVGW